MVLRENLVDNYKLFVGQEDIKMILCNIWFSLDEIGTKLVRVEKLIVYDSKTESVEKQESMVVINVLPLIVNPPVPISPQGKSSSLSPIIISD